MDPFVVKSLRPLSSTDGEGMPEIAGDRGEAVQAEQSGSASHDQEVDIEDLETTAQHPKVARKTLAPTKAMVFEHELHHAECRDWCKHCVPRKGVCHLHRTSEKDHSNAEFSVDNAFVIPNGGDRTQVSNQRGR